ncbi:hypothetical protein T492DRAFT_1130450, partial [Pavlovales sp. CCMP2436]
FRNKQVDGINSQKLRALRGEGNHYTATVFFPHHLSCATLSKILKCCSKRRAATVHRHGTHALQLQEYPSHRSHTKGVRVSFKITYFRLSYKRLSCALLVYTVGWHLVMSNSIQTNSQGGTSGLFSRQKGHDRKDINGDSSDPLQAHSPGRL